MKCFITGASGFLGKRLLQSLVEDAEVEKIFVVSRTKTTHPHPKVEVIPGDLTLPWSSFHVLEQVDHIIHLAGLYRFGLSFHENYKQNVLPVVNLVDRLRQFSRATHRPQIHFASTYAVGISQEGILQEEPLTRIVQSREDYSYTKALGEKVLTDSGLSARIFRLGILVGDSQHGEIEKLDGPYLLMRFLHQLSRLGAAERTLTLPIPAHPEAILPLVPVDSAVRVFLKSLKLPPHTHTSPRVYHVIHLKSASVKKIGEALFRNFLPHSRPKYIQYWIPPSILKLQSKLTAIPPQIFQYVQSTDPLPNSRFSETFADELIPHFDTYSIAFFNGFRRCFNGETKVTDLIRGTQHANS